MQGTLTTTSLPSSVTGTEVAKTNTIFWKFGAGTNIVILFIVVETHDFTNISVLVFLLFFLLDLYCVSGHSRGLLFILPFLMLFPFFFLAALLGRFAGFGPGWGRSCFFYLRLLRVGVFGSCSLGLHLWSGAVRRAVTSGTTNIRVSDHGARS